MHFALCENEHCVSGTVSYSFFLLLQRDRLQHFEDYHCRRCVREGGKGGGRECWASGRAIEVEFVDTVRCQRFGKVHASIHLLLRRLTK